MQGAGRGPWPGQPFLGAVLCRGLPRKPRPAALSLTAPGRRSSSREAVAAAASGLGEAAPPARR